MNDVDSNLAMNAIAHAAHMIQASWQSAAALNETVSLQNMRPFMILKPRVLPDGNQWCALYGDDLQTGVAGFGVTPDEASRQFDIEWLNARCGPKEQSK